MEFLFQVFDSKWMAWVWTKGKLKELVHSYCFKICLERLIVLRKQQTNVPPRVPTALHPENWRLHRYLCHTVGSFVVFRDLYVFINLVGRSYAHMCAAVLWGWRCLISLELDCALVSWLMWALGTELRSSTSADRHFSSPLNSFR